MWAQIAADSSNDYEVIGTRKVYQKRRTNHPRGLDVRRESEESEETGGEGGRFVGSS